AAGMAGIEGEYELPEGAEDAVWDLTERERRAMGIEPLPTDLFRALEAFEGSELMASTLGEQVFEFFLRDKRQEWQRYREEVTAVSTEPSTTTGALARLGFSSTDRVRRFLAEPALAGLADGAAAALGRTADGDDAVLGLLRLAEAAREAGRDALLTEFLEGVGKEGSAGQRLITLLGTSVALGDFLTRHPEHLALLREGDDELAVTAEAV